MTESITNIILRRQRDTIACQATRIRQLERDLAIALLRIRANAIPRRRRTVVVDNRDEWRRKVAIHKANETNP